MDNEKETRADLMRGLSPAFDCYEHVRVRHVVFSGHVLTADVIAVPKESPFSGLTLAFECKNPPASDDEAPRYRLGYWADAIHQASDYVYAVVEAGGSLKHLNGRRISSSFVFSTHLPFEMNADELELAKWKLEDLQEDLRIAFQTASRFRVGYSYSFLSKAGHPLNLSLHLGGEFWRSNWGFCGHALGILKGKRRLGSRKLDVLTELSGVDVK